MPRQIATLSLSEARQFIAAAEAKAPELGVPSNIAVVDAGGSLSSSLRIRRAASVTREFTHRTHLPSDSLGS
jgi:uncharacterized protein GlcG (DUF336 family)